MKPVVIFLAFLVLEGIGCFLWWALLLAVPAARAPFLVPGAPDAVLLAFVLPDSLLYATAAFAAAFGLHHQKRWAFAVLCVHAGAAIYAELYVLALAIMTGGGWLGAVLMAPPLVILPAIIWYTHREKEHV